MYQSAVHHPPLLAVLQENAADWGILSPDNDERNGIVWYPGIEQVSVFAAGYHLGVLDLGC